MAGALRFRRWSRHTLRLQHLIGHWLDTGQIIKVDKIQVVRGEKHRPHCSDHARTNVGRRQTRTHPIADAKTCCCHTTLLRSIEGHILQSRYHVYKRLEPIVRGFDDSSPHTAPLLDLPILWPPTRASEHRAAASVLFGGMPTGETRRARRPPLRRPGVYPHGVPRPPGQAADLLLGAVQETRGILASRLNLPGRYPIIAQKCQW